MRIGEASRASGASPRALRLYEEEGLIVPGRCSNGYRDYCPSTVERVRVIRHLMDAGVPVRFLKQVLPMVVGETTMDPEAMQEVAAYLDRLSGRIEALERQRSALGEFLLQVQVREVLTLTHAAGS